MGLTSTADRLLVLMRHAKSSWSTGDPDHTRPLSVRGRRDASAAGQWLDSQGLRPDLVVVSTAARTRETFSRLQKGGALFDRVVYADEVYAADQDGLLRLLSQADPEVRTLMVIGHNPAVEETVNLLARRVGNHEWWTAMDAKFPTAAIAVIGFDGDWSDVGPGDGALLAYEVPRG